MSFICHYFLQNLMCVPDFPSPLIRSINFIVINLFHFCFHFIQNFVNIYTTYIMRTSLLLYSRHFSICVLQPSSGCIRWNFSPNLLFSSLGYLFSNYMCRAIFLSTSSSVNSFQKLNSPSICSLCCVHVLNSHHFGLNHFCYCSTNVFINWAMYRNYTR